MARKKISTTNAAAASGGPPPSIKDLQKQIIAECQATVDARQRLFDRSSSLSSGTISKDVLDQLDIDLHEAKVYLLIAQIEFAKP